MFNWLVEIDKQIFLLINQQFTNSFFDWLFPIWRDSTTWIPLYILILFIAIKKLKYRSWVWFLLALTTILLTDQISSHIIKPLIARARPCVDVDFASKVRLLLPHCPGGFSFTSSHACNHFGIALFFITTLSQYLNKWKYLFLIWACVVCYSQIYVGVHYPIDVIFGALIGTIIGKFTGQYCLSKLKIKTINN